MQLAVVDRVDASNSCDYDCLDGGISQEAKNPMNMLLIPLLCGTFLWHLLGKSVTRWEGGTLL